MENDKELKLNKQKYSQFDSDDSLENDLRSRGLNIFSWSDGPGTRYAPHQHGHDEIIVVLSGAIEFSINGNSFLLEKGDELVLPKGTVHSARVPDSASVRYLICS